MISTETRKYILRLILACVVYSPVANATCDSNKRLYTEIGCNPVYGKDLNACPVAYDCENVFTRPNDKCYFNGNVYEPWATLSQTDAALNPCLTGCFCDQHSDNNKTLTKFVCAHVKCTSYFKLVAEPCYLQYDKDLCCETNSYCPEKETILHECTYNGLMYREGQRINIDDFTHCVCSASFNGTFNDGSCRKDGCSSEILYMENILKRSAPVFFEKTDGCPIEWYHPDYDITNTTSVADKSASSGPVCWFGNLRFPVGQIVAIGGEQSDSDDYKTSCSCSVPPLMTCIKTII